MWLNRSSLSASAWTSAAALGGSLLAQRRRLECEYRPANAAGFPSTVRRANQDYFLVSTGTRRVTFLGIAVYDIGIYINENDASSLRNAIKDAQFGTSDNARHVLADATAGKIFLENVIPDIAFAIRIVPVRNTDIAHIRDGFMRGITAREASPDAGALRDFKDFFPNPKQPFKKGQVMMLFASKGLDAGIQMTVDDHEYGEFRVREGRPLITAFVANYICGRKVASEAVRAEFVREIVADAEVA